jgi:hypothetical protein
LIDTWRTAEGSVCDLHESFLYVVSLKAIADPSGKVVAPNAEVARTATGILLGTRTSVLPNIEENSCSVFRHHLLTPKSHRPF